MNRPLTGTTPEGLTWRRARLDQIFPGIVSREWRWALYSQAGEFLRNFATRREMLDYSARFGTRIRAVVVKEWQA